MSLLSTNVIKNKLAKSPDSITQQGKSQWKTKRLTMLVADSLTNDAEKEINVVETLVHDICFPYTSFNVDDV